MWAGLPPQVHDWTQLWRTILPKFSTNGESIGHATDTVRVQPYSRRVLIGKAGVNYAILNN
jgi:hypothetical protein